MIYIIIGAVAIALVGIGAYNLYLDLDSMRVKKRNRQREQLMKSLSSGRYTFSCNGDHFSVEAKNQSEAWEKVRRITGSNTGNVRIIQR